MTQSAYSDLVDRLADDAPDGGYRQPDDLPPLSEEDYALIAAQHPGTVNEVTLNGAALATIWAITPADQLSTHAGVYFLTAIRSGLLGAVYYDVMSECEARAERSQHAADEAYYGGSAVTHRERLMSELGLRERDFTERGR